MKALEYLKCMACNEIKKVDVYSDAWKLEMCQECYEEIEDKLI
jgi:hypothetical protein